jgi:hypothetical protein
MSEKITRTEQKVKEPFALGSGDVFIDGERRFYWNPGPYDGMLALHAGWKDLRLTEQDRSYLLVPEGTRNASSVLGGTEAYSGEKRDLLAFITDYTAQMLHRFGAVDISVNLNKLAVTRGEDRRCFIVPAHDLSADPESIATWRALLVEDVREVVSLEQNPELIEDFMDVINDLLRGEGNDQ